MGSTESLRLYNISRYFLTTKLNMMSSQPTCFEANLLIFFLVLLQLFLLFLHYAILLLYCNVVSPGQLFLAWTVEFWW